MVRAKSTGPVGPKDVPSPTEASHDPVGGAGTPAGAAQPLQKPSSPMQGGPGGPQVGAGAMGPLDAPTNRPNEPITAGVGGAAAARAAAQAGGARVGTDTDAAIRALYSLYPHPHLLELMK